MRHGTSEASSSGSGEFQRCGTVGVHGSFSSFYNNLLTITANRLFLVKESNISVTRAVDGVP